MNPAPYVIFNSGTNQEQLSVTLVAVEPSRLFMTAPPPGRAEIGRYVHEIGEERIDHVRRLLRDSGYRELPDPEPVPPGTTLLSIAEGAYGSAPDSIRAFPVGAIPTELDDFLAEMDDVIRLFLKHPHRVVRGRAWVETDIVQPGDEIPVVITLRNIGEAPLQIGNSAGAASDDRVSISLVFTSEIERGAPGETESQSATAGQINFRVGDVAQLRPDGEPEPSPTEVVELEAGEELRLRVAPRALLRPGEYSGYVIYRSMPEKLEGDLTVWGRVTMTLPQFVFGDRE